MSAPHVYFRKLAFQRYLRCMTPGCGFIARTDRAHVEHANGTPTDQETQ